MISIDSGTDGARTMTGWKRRSRAPSFSMYFRYSSSVVAPMVWISPRERAGFSMFEASMAPSAAPAPIRVWSSSRKSTTFSDWRISFMTALSRSSNWPRYFVPATSAPRSSWSRRFWASTSGTSCPTMRWARPSTMAVLPTPGSPMRTGLFLVRRARIWITRSISVSRPMTGSSLPSRASWGQVAGELVEHGGLRALLGPRVVLVAQEGQGFLPDLVQPRSEGLEDLGGDGLALFHEAEEEVLGPDVVVAELARLLDRELEDALGLGGERDFTEGQGLGEAGEGPLDLGLDRF